MALMFKAAGVALVAVLMGLLLKRTNPELSMLLSVCCTAGILLAALGLSQGLQELRQAMGHLWDEAEFYIRPVIKCLGIALLSRFGADFCRDASQGAAASALEFAGSVCAFLVASPLLLKVLKMIGGML